MTGRAKRVTFLALLVVALYLLAVTPVRTFVQQRAQMQKAEQRYEILASTNEQLRARALELQSDAEIKKLARERYELVEPGQQAFAVMPPSAPPPESTEPAKKQEGLPSRVWDAINLFD